MRGRLPVTRVAIYSNIVLARVGLQEYDCDVLLHGSGGGAVKVPVVEVPRKRCVVLPCPRLQRFIRLLSNPFVRKRSPSPRAELRTEIR